MAVELYHFWSSVCSVRCRMALEEKGVPWTSRYIDLFKFGQMQPEYLAINPRGVVPTLVHDGTPVRESSVINEYIEQPSLGHRLHRPTHWALRVCASSFVSATRASQLS
jgi:glutathione S-transferase